MNQRTASCLLLASLPPGSDQRQKLYSYLCSEYTEKAVIRKMEKLDRLDYIDCGVSARTGWLTEKGKKALVDYAEKANDKT